MGVESCFTKSTCHVREIFRAFAARGTILLTLLAMAAPVDGAIACEGTTITRSDKLNLRVDVCPADQPQHDIQWCDVFVDVSIVTEDPEVFRSERFKKLIRRLGNVMHNECPIAYELHMHGYDGSGTLSYQGHAVAKDAWEVFERQP